MKRRTAYYGLMLLQVALMSGGNPLAEVGSRWNAADCCRLIGAQAGCEPVCWAQLDDPADTDRRGQGPGQGRGLGSGRQNREFGKHIEQFRLLKLLELLDLREDQEVAFIAAFRSMRRQQRVVHEEKRAAVEQLTRELHSQPPSDDRVNQLVQHVLDVNARERQVMAEFIEQARRILTPSQLGRLIVFHERFEFELLEAVRGFRERQLPVTDTPPGPDMPEIERESLN
ncbi:MAG TPA: hypothetical protein VN285_10380 [Candidatus Deferrimicrobium sp.]|nr:hypothetical protein [Candidatus Deferrimicrobium sp.]